MKASIQVGHAAPRQKAYMPVGDQLDAITKTLAHLESQGIDIGSDGRQLIQESQKVKSTFPKNSSAVGANG